MKKLLALILVLGMASLASAALSIELQDVGGNPIVAASAGQPFQLAVSGLVADKYTYIGFYDDAGPGGVFDFAPGAVVLPAAGDLGSATLFQDAVYDGYDTGADDIDAGALPNMADGLWLELPAIGLAEGRAGISLFDGNFAVIETYGFDVVPEPMTMALLGLGGLGLLRRRR